MSYVLTDPKNKHYRKALHKEISIDNRSTKDPQWPPDLDLHPKILTYYNKLASGSSNDSEFDWYNIIPKKSYIDCLTLGSQNGRHERHLIKNKIVSRFDSIVLSKPLESNLLTKEVGVNFILDDLNFIALPKDKYDLIFCNGVLHHIINLEHLLYEINKSLKKDGIFICTEFVGENKCQWSDEKLKILNTLIKGQYGNTVEMNNFSKPDLNVMNIRPLEAVRSQEIPELLKYYFNAEWLSMCDYILYPGINYMNFNGVFKDFILNNNGRIDAFLDLLIDCDYRLFKKDSKVCVPNLLKGVFRKKINVPIKSDITPWSKNEIEKQLVSKQNKIKTKIYRKIIKTFKTLWS